MKYNCVYLESEPIGGFSKDMIQYGYRCWVFDKYNDDIICDNCQAYKTEGDND